MNHAHVPKEFYQQIRLSTNLRVTSKNIRYFRWNYFILFAFMFCILYLNKYFYELRFFQYNEC